MESLNILPAVAAVFAGLAVFFIAYAMLAPTIKKPRTSTEDIPTNDAIGKLVKPILNEFIDQLPNLPLNEERSKKLNELIYKSGNPWKLNREELIGIMIAFGITGAIAGAMVALTGQVPTSPAVIILVLAAAGLFYPLSVYRSARQKRTVDMQNNLPEALDLLTVSLSAGETFQPALTSVIKQLPESLLKDELKKVALGIQSGLPLEKSLTDFSKVTDSEEAEAFAKAIIQSQKLGSDVSEVLAQQASYTRNAKETRLEEKIARLNTTLFIPLSLTMLPAFLIIFLAPIIGNLGFELGG